MGIYIVIQVKLTVKINNEAVTITIKINVALETTPVNKTLTGAFFRSIGTNFMVNCFHWSAIGNNKRFTVGMMTLDMKHLNKTVI